MPERGKVRVGGNESEKKNEQTLKGDSRGTKEMTVGGKSHWKIMK